ncbi:hypothetical protein [Microbulbifer variabilis]|uniref:hypothetical protein n=1 Tax=Microbulbifer variabilis TaxID=266805 RepID=UPI001CFD92D3|nr:hypothetical protein [Microbulbifer variabilis]
MKATIFKSKIILCCILLICGCANTQLEIEGNDFAILQSGHSKHEGQLLSLMFALSDGVELKPGVWTKGIKAAYRIPSGTRNIVTKIVFSPKSTFPKTPQLLVAYFAFTLEAQKGETYYIKALVENGIVTSWIVNSHNEIVVPAMEERLKPLPYTTIVPVIL